MSNSPHISLQAVLLKTLSCNIFLILQQTPGCTVQGILEYRGVHGGMAQPSFCCTVDTLNRWAVRYAYGRHEQGMQLEEGRYIWGKWCSMVGYRAQMEIQCCCWRSHLWKDPYAGGYKVKLLHLSHYALVLLEAHNLCD